MKQINVSDILKEFPKLELITKDSDLEQVITEIDVSRPGVQLIGFFDYFTNNRIQIFGKQEISYLEKINYDPKIIDKFLSYKIPLIIFCRGEIPSQSFIDKANEFKIPICITKSATNKINTRIFSFLEYSLAPEVQLHGVLVSVFGIGVMIRGVSGIGKSEVALELIHRGHLLVADDAVVIKRVDENTLIGSSPKLLKNRLEIRGIGIVDIQKLYGITKVISSKRISLIVEIGDMTGQEDRIGNKEETCSILDCNVPLLKIPISVGRSVSNLIEVAVANYELKNSHDCDTAQLFINELNDMLIGDLNE